jgi:membrane protein YqaA with SNARE-associated domain
MILTFTLGSLLNPLYIGLVAGVGNTIGNSFIYYTGHAGLKLFTDFSNSNSRVGRILNSERIARIVNSKNWGELAVVFLLFLYPNPASTPLILAMGAERFSFPKFLVTCWSAKTAQGLILAYLGHLGLRSLLHFFGVFNVH